MTELGKKGEKRTRHSAMRKKKRKKRVKIEGMGGRRM